MLFKSSLLLASTFALSAVATPIPEGKAAGAITAETIIAISPATASCDGAEFPNECADATRAATAINKSFKKYKIESAGEKAALLAVMLFESGDFKYSVNHYPGRPGQGTRNMQMITFNTQYATELFGADAVAQAQAQGDNAVLALVNGSDENSFGSAAWFLSSQSNCGETIKQGLSSGSVEGWHAYLTQCIGTTADPARDPAWQAALKALQGTGGY